MSEYRKVTSDAELSGDHRSELQKWQNLHERLSADNLSCPDCSDLRDMVLELLELLP